MKPAIALAAAAACVLIAGSAAADDILYDQFPEPSDTGASATAEEEVLANPLDWDEEHPKILAEAALAQRGPYGTYYLMPLVRHMPESGLPKGWQYVAYPFAAVLDIAQLPLGAIAGLYGD